MSSNFPPKISGVVLGGVLVLAMTAARADETAPAQTGADATAAAPITAPAPAAAPDNAGVITPAENNAVNGLPAPRLNNEVTESTVVISPSRGGNGTGTATTAPRTRVVPPAPKGTPVNLNTKLTIPRWKRQRVSSSRQASAWRYVERGTRAMRTNSWNAALGNYQHAAQLDPNNTYALSGVADNLLILGRYGQAETAYRRALSRTPGNAKLIRGLGDSLVPQRKYSQAVAAYKMLLAKSPRDYTANYQIAQILTWNSQYSAADGYYRRALAIQPRNATAWAAWGEALTFEKSPRAADAFNRALQIQPNFVRALVGLGNTHLWDADYPPAISAFSKAVSIAPRNTAALVGLGDALTFSSRSADAIPLYQRALSYEPYAANSGARLGMARALVLAKREKEALPYLQQVLAREPRNEEALNLLADAQSAASPNSALATLQRLLQQQNDPADRAATLVKIANLQAQNGDIEKAKTSYTQAIALDPRETENYLAYAQALITEGQWSEARQVVEDALHNEPSSVRALILQVAVESKAGTPERANALATRALALNITDPQDALVLANAMRTAGNKDGSDKILQRLAAQANNATPVQALEIATAIRDAGMYDLAAPIFENLVKDNPKNGEAHLKLAEMLLWQKEYDGAEKHVGILLASDPDNIEARVLRGTIALRRDEATGSAIAAKEADTILAQNPRNADALLLRTQVLSLRQRFADAVTAAQAAVDSEPNNLEARLALARNLYYARETSASIEQYRELVKRAPTDSALKIELAKIYLDQNLLSDAESLYSQVLGATGTLLPPVARNEDGVYVKSYARVSPAFFKSDKRAAKMRLAAADVPTEVAPPTVVSIAPLLDPSLDDQISANVGMGEVRRRQGRYDESLDYFDSALKLDSASPDARLGRARALRGKSDYLKSLAETERLLQTDEKNLGARVLHAQLLADTGDKAKAQEELDALVDGLPANPPLETYLDLSSAFVELQNYDAATKLLNVAIQDFPDRVEAQQRMGETLTFAKRWDEASAVWDKLIALDPKDASAVLGKARVYNYSTHLTEAEQTYRKVLELEPDNYPALTELADILARQSQYPDAIALYKQAIAKNPNDLKTRVELARVLRYNRNFSEAEAMATEIIGVDDRYAPAYTERSLARSATGNYEAAIADARQALAIAPGDTMAQLGLAEVLSYTKKYDESIELYRAALERDPNNAKARTELAAVLSYSGKYDEALREVNTVLKDNPENLDAQIVKADTYARSGHYKEANALYKAILQQDSRNMRARVGLAEAYAYNRQYDDAIKIYDELIALDPANPAYRIAKGKTLAYARRYPQAVSTLRAVVAENPNSLEARLALADVMTNSGNPGLRREAVAQYQTILQQNPGNVDARVGLGRVYSYSGRYKEADTQLNGVLKDYPGNTEARFALAESQRFAGKDFDARDNYERVLKTEPQNVGARAGLASTRRTTSPSITASVNRYSDSNNVKVHGYTIGAQVPTRQGTIGLSREFGTFEDEGVEMRRRALTLLLARRFGAVQARLLLSKVDYGNAPDKTLYDLNLQRSFGNRKRIYVTLAKRDVIESIEAVQAGITARVYQVGGEFPLGKHFDADLDVTHYQYSDDNSRTSISPSLYFRFKPTNPTLRLGIGYRNDNTRETGRPYYTPQDYNAAVLLADYAKDTGKFQYGVFGAHPLTKSTGGGLNRPADTLFGFATYELSDLVDLFVNGGVVRSPDFDSNSFTAGATIRF